MQTAGQQATELAAKLYQSESPDKPTRPEQEQRAELVSVTLWQRLTEIFGPLFVNQFGDLDGPGRQTWKRGLAQYSEHQIRRGIDNCRSWVNDSGKSYPPNLPEFSRLCLTETIHKQVDRKKLDYRPVTTPEIVAREKERQRLIANSPKSRDPSEGDVESFMESYRRLGLAKRLGAAQPTDSGSPKSQGAK